MGDTWERDPPNQTESLTSLLDWHTSKRGGLTIKRLLMSFALTLFFLALGTSSKPPTFALVPSLVSSAVPIDCKDGCRAERWNIKTLTDDNADNVDFTPKEKSADSDCNCRLRYRPKICWRDHGDIQLHVPGRWVSIFRFVWLLRVMVRQL